MQQTNEQGSGVFYAARQAIHHHTSGGNVLIFATVLALIVANIPALNSYYTWFWEQEVRLQLGGFNFFSHGGHPMSLLAFINDALMAVFFFSIGLEIKREVLVGELASLKQALLPIVAAAGGMIIPVGVYMLFAAGADYAVGAAVPMATDIAFALGILALFSSRVPIALKVFLTTLAVVDDIGGIIVIAIFYSSHIDVALLGYSALLLVALILGARFHIKSKAYYVIIGLVVWFLFLNSGIHPTIAGVLVAFCIPASPVYAPAKYLRTIRTSINHFRAEDDATLSRKTILSHEQMDWLKQIESASDKVISPLQDLEDSLHPIVNYMIIPLFAFANAGICFLDMNPAQIFSGVSLAIIVGLLVGKFIGIFTFSWLAVKTGLAPMPKHTNWAMMSAAAVLGGIGFTVALFIANLSFGGEEMTTSAMLSQAKLGIIIGSALAGVGGYLLLNRFLPKFAPDQAEMEI